MNLPDEIQTEERYSPRQTEAIRKAAVADVLNAQTSLLVKAQHKTNLRNLEEVQRVVYDYMKVCGEVGIVPTLEALAARLGLSRNHIYRFIRENPSDPTAEFLNQARLMWAGARMSLGERGFLNAPMSIFILKNSGLDFADKHELEIDQVDKDDRPPWARGLSEEELVRKYIECLPEPYDE